MGTLWQADDGSEIHVVAEITPELGVLPGLLLERREAMPARGFRWVSIDPGAQQTTIVFGPGMIAVDRSDGYTRVVIEAPLDVAAWATVEVLHTIRPQYGMIDTTGVGLWLYQQLAERCRGMDIDLHRIPGLERR